MNKISIYIISTILLFAFFTVPLLLTNCSVNQVFMVLGCQISANYCGGINLQHFNLMRNMLAIGLMLSAAFLIFCLHFYSRRKINNFDLNSDELKKYYFNKRLNIYNLSKLYDKFKLALSQGLIQPKVF